jgi:hypothetical protein
VCELARTVSQQSTSRVASLRDELAAAQDSARRARRRASAADKAARESRDEAAVLRGRLLLLERALLSRDSDSTGMSACGRAFLFSQASSLY